MAKEQLTYLNKIYKGKRKLEGGTFSIQMEQYEGLKYITGILNFLKANPGSHKFSEIKESLSMPQEEYIPDIVFIQLRILKLIEKAVKVEDREFELGEFGEFLSNNYIKTNPKALLLAAYLIFSIIPFAIYDIYTILNEEFKESTFKKTLIIKKLNKAKRIAIFELLGIHSSSSGHIYETIPLFSLKEEKKGKKKLKIIREDKPSIRDKASVICLHYILSDAYKNIKAIVREENIPYIKLEDLYFYLVRPEVLIENYNLKKFLEDEYPYSGVFYFVRTDDVFNKEINGNINYKNYDIDWFFETFENIRIKAQNLIKVDEILDQVIISNLKIPELHYRITLIGEN